MVTHVLQVLLEQVGCHPGGHRFPVCIVCGLPTASSGQQQFLDPIDRQVAIRVERGAAAFVEFGDERQFTQDKIERRRLDEVSFGTIRRRDGNLIFRPLLIGLANPGPVGQVTEATDGVVFQLQLVKLERHPGDACRLLRSFGRWIQDRHHGGDIGRIGQALQRIGVGRQKGEGLEWHDLTIDIGARDAFTHRDPDAHDDRLTRIDRHVVHSGAAIRSRFLLHNHTDGRQVGDGFFERSLERRWERHRQTIDRAADQPLPHFLRDVSAPVEDGEQVEARREAKDGIGA